MIKSLEIASLLLVYSVFGTASAASAGPGPTGASAAVAYCKSTGGVPEIYYYYDYSGHVYARSARVCNYPDASGTDPYGHAIVDLVTLYAEKPTLAALAYYAKPAWNGKTVTGQPAKDYCLQLGAAPSTHGSYKRYRNDGESGMCMFEDGSYMEEWTLFYNQGGSPRGIDLTTVLRFPNPY